MKNLKMSRLIPAILLAGLLLLGLAGCTNMFGGETLPSPSPSADVLQPINTPTPSVSPGTATTLPGTTEPPAAPTLSNQESASLAGKFDERIGKVSEIASSVSVLLSYQAVTGVTFDAAYRGDLTPRIQEIIQQQVKDVNPDVKDIRVTADPELVTRITALREKQQGGAGTQELQAEFDAIRSTISK